MARSRYICPPRESGDDKEEKRTGTGLRGDAFILGANVCSSTRVRDMAEERIRESPDEGRQAVKGHNVRYVLAFGLGGAIIAMVIVYFAFFR
jgi:hypothetical protein